MGSCTCHERFPPPQFVKFPPGWQPPPEHELPPGLFELLSEGLTYETRPMDDDDPDAGQWDCEDGPGQWATLRRNGEAYTLPFMWTPDAPDGFDLAAELALFLNSGSTAWGFDPDEDVFATLDVDADPAGMGLVWIYDRGTIHERVRSCPPIRQESIDAADGLRRLFGVELARQAIDAYSAYGLPPASAVAPELPAGRGTRTVPPAVRAMIEDGLTVLWVGGQTDDWGEPGLRVILTKGAQTMTTWCPSASDDPDQPTLDMDFLLNRLINRARAAVDRDRQKANQGLAVEAMLEDFAADVQGVFGPHSNEVLALSVDDEGVEDHPALRLLAQTAGMARQLRVDSEIRQALGPAREGDGRAFARLLGSDLTEQILDLDDAARREGDAAQ